MSILDARTHWTAELAKEQAMVAEQLRDLRHIQLALDTTALGSPSAGQSSHMLNMQEYLRQQKRQLKHRAKELEKSRRQWRAPTDLPRLYPEPTNSGSGLATTLHDMIQLQNAEHNDQIRTLTHMMQQLGHRRPKDSSHPRANRASHHTRASGVRQQLSAPHPIPVYSPPAVESRASSAPCHPWAGGNQAPACYQPIGCAWDGSLASVCAPAYADPRLKVSEPPTRLRRLASASQWEHTQNVQQQLIRDQADWLHGFKERLRYAAGLASVGRNTQRAAIPLPKQRHPPEVRSSSTDKATISLDGRTQVEIRIVRR